MTSRPGIRIALALALFGCAGASAAPARPTTAASRVTDKDPIEGKWAGEVGTPRDRVEIGLEFRRNARGELKAFLHQHVMNFYGLELPSVVVRKGDTYRLEGEAITLTLKDGTLTGTYFPLNDPITLRRSDTLPMETPVPTLPRGPGPKWQTKLGGEVWAPAAITDGVAYVGTTNGIFNAVRLQDGQFAWTFVAGRPIFGEALATADHVYFVCDNGFLFKLERRSGKEVWRYDLGDAQVARPLDHPILSEIGIGDFDIERSAPRPLLVGATLYVGSGDGSLHAIDAAKGRRIWRFAGQGKVRSDAVVAGERVLFGTIAGVVFAVDRATGKELWRKETHAAITGSPAIVDDKLILGNRGGLVAALALDGGKVLWRALMWGSAVESTPVAGAPGVFYIGASDLRRISAMASDDGRVIWRTDVYGWAWARPAITPTRVYASAIGVTPYQMRHLGGFSALDRSTGATVWRWEMPAWPGALYSGFMAGPAVADGLVIVGGLDGTLYAFPDD